MGAAHSSILSEAPFRTVDELSSTYVDYSGNGPWHTSLPDAVLPQRYAKTGVASSDTEPVTLMTMLQKAAAAGAGLPALMVERPVPAQDAEGTAPPALPEEEWTTWTWQEYLDDVRSIAKAFIQLGFSPHDSVNVWGFNAPEWMISAMAAGFAGGKVAGLYPTDGIEAAAFKVVHSCGSIVVIEDRGKLDRLVKGLNARGDCKRVKAFVAYGFEPADGEAVAIEGCGNIPVLAWSEVLRRGRADLDDAGLDQRAAAVEPGNCAALIYTSGTTGEPKAVMCSHDNIGFECTCVASLMKTAGVGTTKSQERNLSYLPLSHVAGMMVDIATPVFITATGPAWWTTYFARPYDLKVGTVKDRLCVAKPTVFLGVPLVWEMIADRIRAIGATKTGLQKSIGTWAKGRGLDHAKNCQLGGNGAYPPGYFLADKLVHSKIKKNLGLQHLKYAFTGAAPIRVDTLEFFGMLGIHINEVYGMSECTGACTWSVENCHYWGSCGSEMPGVEVRVFTCDEKDMNKKTECPPAPDFNTTEEKYQGELCFRGRNIMMGYMACPDMGPDHLKEIQKKTAESIDADGWLHSGDKGMITDAGMVKITGRYKELIIGEGGENIAPVPIEDVVKKSCDGICEVMMVGDKRKYNVALVTLKAVGANGESAGTEALDAGAKRLNPAVTTIPQAMDDKTWIDAVTAAVLAANNDPKVCINPTFKIQKFMILPTNFSEEFGDLTPTKKLKRKAVEIRFKDAIEKMYATDGVYIHY